MFYDQAEFDLRFEWGERGASALAPISDVVVIVDILSISTCVDIATVRGATVFPYRRKDSSCDAFAAARNATVGVPVQLQSGRSDAEGWRIRECGLATRGCIAIPGLMVQSFPSHA